MRLLCANATAVPVSVHRRCIAINTYTTLWTFYTATVSVQIGLIQVKIVITKPWPAPCCHTGVCVCCVCVYAYELRMCVFDSRACANCSRSHRDCKGQSQHPFAPVVLISYAAQNENQNSVLISHAAHNENKNSLSSFPFLRPFCTIYSCQQKTAPTKSHHGTSEWCRGTSAAPWPGATSSSRRWLHPVQPHASAWHTAGWHGFFAAGKTAP